MSEPPASAPADRSGPLDTLRRLAALGYDGVDLSIRDPARVDLDAVGEAAALLGIAVPMIATGQAYVREGLSLTSPDDSLREGAVARLLAQVEAAARLGAMLAIGVIHGPIPAGDGRERAEARLLGSLARLARGARRSGVRIVIEPIHRYSTNWLHTAHDVVRLIGRLGEENIGVLLDTFHMNIEEADPIAAMREAAPRLWHFHVAENNRRAPGWGHLDFGRCVAALRAIGYDRFVSAEVSPDPTLEAAARQTISAMRPLVHADRA